MIVMPLLEYDRTEWRLCIDHPNIVEHLLGLTFVIEGDGMELRPYLLHVKEPDKVLKQDVDDLTQLAVWAYLDLVGWNEPDRPEFCTEGRWPKPVGKEVRNRGVCKSREPRPF